MGFYNAASLDAANETTVPLDTAALFSGAGRYPPKIGAVVHRTAGNSNFNVRVELGADDGGTIRWTELVAITANATATELTYFPEMQYRMRVATRGSGNTLRCAFFL